MPSGGALEDVRVVIEVSPVAEHADLVEQSVARKVVPLPVTNAVPLQSWMAVWLQTHVVAVTFVTSTPVQALVVRQAWDVIVELPDTKSGNIATREGCRAASPTGRCLNWPRGLGRLV